MKTGQCLFNLQFLIRAFFLVCLAAPAISYSQFSGDAGLMSSGDFDARSRAMDTPTRLYFVQQAGLGTDDVICLNSEFQFDWNVWGGINLWFAFPYRVAMGELATIHGIGDLRVVISHTLAEAGDFAVKINVGGVVPSGYADKDLDGKPLPMVYQSTGGSPAFMTAAVFYYRRWCLAAGYQRAVSGNRNDFTSSAWQEDERVTGFTDSPGLWPGDDLVFRLSKYFDRPKANYSLNVLPAFRLFEDRVLQDGKHTNVPGSSGFTLNLSAGLEVRMGRYGYFHALAAAPLVNREVYPDGLYRMLTLLAGFGVLLPE